MEAMDATLWGWGNALAMVILVPAWIGTLVLARALLTDRFNLVDREW